MRADMSKPAGASTGKELREIVLASGSPRRLELLRSLGFAVEVARSGYDEPNDERLAPPELAAHHARAKLDLVRPRFPAAAVVAADTVVDLDGHSLGKPNDAREAAIMLRSLSGRSHRVHSAYALALPGAQAPLERLSTTLVRFHHLSEDEIAAYVATGEPMDKAGAYGIQGRATALVETIDGDYCTVVGFPLGDFIRTLQDLGFRLPSAK